MPTSSPGIFKLGLKENWKQFSLLVLIKAFAGGMAGLERIILPEIAESEYGMNKLNTPVAKKDIQSKTH